uniref:Uncharacterized protein n=1 Tax=Arundo donax TaxID=35708 RepID=A0A0A9F697_ARUDO
MKTPAKLYFSNIVSIIFSRFFTGLSGGSVSRILHSDGSTLSSL